MPKILNELTHELQRYARVRSRNDSALAGFELGSVPPEEVFWKVKELRNIKLELWTKERVRDVAKGIREGVKNPEDFIVDVTLAGAGLKALNATERDISKEIGRGTTVNWKVVLLGLMVLSAITFVVVKKVKTKTS